MLNVSNGKDAVRGVLQPVRGIATSIVIEASADPQWLMGVEAYLLIKGDLISTAYVPDRQRPFSETSIEKGQSWPLTCMFALADETLMRIEQKRDPSAHTLSFDLHLRLIHSGGGQVRWGDYRLQKNVATSDWLEALRNIRWEDYAVLEVPFLHVHDAEFLRDSVRLLKEAGTAYRLGDYETSVVKCRKVFESASRGLAADTKEGFAAWLRKAWPTHEPARVLVDSIISAMAAHANQTARHAQSPPIRPSREEALFILTLTTSVLSVTSQLAAKNRGSP